MSAAELLGSTAAFAQGNENAAWLSFAQVEACSESTALRLVARTLAHVPKLRSSWISLRGGMRTDMQLPEPICKLGRGQVDVANSACFQDHNGFIDRDELASIMYKVSHANLCRFVAWLCGTMIRCLRVSARTRVLTAKVWAPCVRSDFITLVDVSELPSANCCSSLQARRSVTPGATTRRACQSAAKLKDRRATGVH